MRKLSLNENWQFKKLPGFSLDSLPSSLPPEDWETVSLPHTWYSDSDPYQGLAVYEKTVSCPADCRKAFLSFDGADQRCRVFVNGHPAGSHAGGYARFRLAVPEAALAEAEEQVAAARQAAEAAREAAKQAQAAAEHASKAAGSSDDAEGGE